MRSKSRTYCAVGIFIATEGLGEMIPLRDDGGCKCRSDAKAVLKDGVPSNFIGSLSAQDVLEWELNSRG